MSVWAYNRHLETELEVIAQYQQGGETHLIYKDARPAFAQLLRDRIKDDRQNVVFCGGATGSGKSTFAVQMCGLVDKNWDLEANYIYDIADLRAKLDSPQSDVSLFDEGSVSLNAGNSMRSDDKQLAVLFDTMRSLKWTTFIVAPRIAAINKRVRETHVEYLCQVPSSPIIPGYDPRGCVQIYHKIQSDWSDKTYWQLIATTLFPKLTPRAQREYDAIKKEHQMRLLADFIRSDKSTESA